ncbi:fasciclin domain-containing protein [Saccharicrinis sp. FJH2]|uniref:fasciclin domain-containing protein n=1 Tax=Saccharicrinis sp. FJH65 TaxID=3344659 RepID=UPI0035F498E9
MKKQFFVFAFIILNLLVLFSGCEDKKAKYYERPEWLEPPILTQLEQRGNFTSLLACIEKAGYAKSLGAAGYFTLFAPTDEAFNQYFAANGYASVSDLDSVKARNIVQYLLLQNAYSEDQLDDYQSSAQELWIENEAFKRQTNYYKWIYEDTVDGVMEKVLDVNAVAGGESNSNYSATDDYNYKNIPYFTRDYLAEQNLSDYDYEYFFPGVSLDSFNVVDAHLMEGDIYAENGVIHVIDKVLSPLQNLEEFLAGKEEYSMFRDIINRYLRNYTIAPSWVSSLYEQATGSTQNIYVKGYSNMAFAPNCENFLRYGEGGEDYDNQKNGWTMFAPTNAAVQQFFDNKFLKYYSSLDQMTTSQIADFVNAHLWLTTVWPSKFDMAQNIYGEEARFDPTADVVDKKVCSNGMFYGVNKVQATDLYYTVLGDINLNPDYVIMLQAIRSFPTILSLLKNTEVDLQLFLINNDQMTNMGFFWNGDLNRWEFTENYNGSLGDNATNALERLLYLHMIEGENVDFSGQGIVRTGIDDRGEYIRYFTQGRTYVWASGNGTALSILSGEVDSEPSNGQSYTLSTPLRFSIDNIGVQLESNSAFRNFYRYLEKSATSLSEIGASMEGYLYNTETKAITDVANTNNNTFLIPSNAAMDQAVADGVLPPITISDFTQAEQERVAAFVNYHILPKRIIVPQEGFKDGAVTLYKTTDGDTYITISSDGTDLTIIDSQTREAKTVNRYSNILANRAVIHQIDNYLRYPQN